MGLEPQTYTHALCDLDAALSAVDGDRELLCRMIGLFVTQSSQLLDAIDTAVARGDGIALQRAAHTLRGSVCNFGAARTYDAASRLEKCGRESDWAAAAATQADLVKAMAELEAALVEFSTGKAP